MSIVAKCACGNRLNLADVMAGKTIPCGKCGGDVDVPVSGSSPAKGTGKTSGKPAAAKGGGIPAVHISPGLIIGAVVGVVLLVVVLSLYLGPWTVGNQWAAMQPTASSQVTDVVQYALQTYETENHLYDAARSHLGPMVDGPVAWVPPMMAFSMPKRIIFSGKTNRGNYMGTYDTTNDEVAVDIEIGGTTVGGLVDVKKATGKIHAIGTSKDGKVQAELR